MAKNLRVVRSGVTLSYGLWRLGLTPKAIGLLYTILGLSDIPDWNFSVNGLVNLFQEAGTGKDAIQSGIEELQRAGLLIRERVRRTDGTLGGSDWIVSDQPMTQAQPMAGFPAQAPSAPMAGFPPQVDPAQYRNLEREEETPVSPRDLTAHGEQTTPRRGRPKKPGLTPSEVPAALAPVAERLCHWWNHAKAGARSQQALASLLSNLEKIREQGGIEAVADQIELAIEAKVQRGKGWQSITHRHWLQFAPRDVLQQAQQRVKALEPTGEQREILELAQGRPELFQASGINAEGRVWLRFTRSALEAASRAVSNPYPESTTAATVEATKAEIAFLEHAMGQRDQGLDSFACPF